MYRSIVLALVAFVAQASCEAIHRPKDSVPYMEATGTYVFGIGGGVSYVLEQRGDLKESSLVMNNSSDKPSNETMGMDFYHDQRLDHFDLSDERRWSQRFAWRTDFYNHTGPVFIQIGGEGAIGMGYVTNLYYVDLAEEHGALLLAPEHRFYGESRPLPDLSVRSLEYLSSAQALEDLARFQAWAFEHFHVPKSTPVIVFGGSYPGNLSAWYRLKYPHLAIGSIASSAPVEAETDFYQYLEVVAHALRYYGGGACEDRVRKAFSAIDIILNDRRDTEDRRLLASAFNVCELKPDVDDDASLMDFLAGTIMGMTQYNAEIPGQPTVEDFCNVILGRTAPENDLLALAHAYYKLFDLPPGKCIDTSYDASLGMLRSPAYTAQRSWLWQTCYEFGYYQTTDGSDKMHGKYDIFGTHSPLNYWLQLCQDLYGSLNRPPTSEINRRYGGKAFAGSNILFLNGGIDPWHALSILQSDRPHISISFNPASAHCANMHKKFDGEAAGLDEMRSEMGRYVAKWLCEHSNDLCS
eukprot:Clim_evm17s206 gene=Clim_evmTU17s206